MKCISACQVYGILFGHKKAWSTEKCYNIDELLKLAQQKKPVTLYDLTYTKGQTKENN
jgi:hypothetical protein